MIRSRVRQLLIVAAAIWLVSAAATVGSALGAYPPGPGKGSVPKAKCLISTIVGRRVAVLCNAGATRVGKRCSIRVRTVVVARGKVGKGGRYFARFTVKTLLARGTRINFVVEGKTVATLRV
jgi:hypothetical protein